MLFLSNCFSKSGNYVLCHFWYKLDTCLDNLGNCVFILRFVFGDFFTKVIVYTEFWSIYDNFYIYIVDKTHSIESHFLIYFLQIRKLFFFTFLVQVSTGFGVFFSILIFLDFHINHNMFTPNSISLFWRSLLWSPQHHHNISPWNSSDPDWQVNHRRCLINFGWFSIKLNDSQMGVNFLILCFSRSLEKPSWISGAGVVLTCGFHITWRELL